MPAKTSIILLFLIFLVVFPHPSMSGIGDIWLECGSASYPAGSTKTMGGTTYYCCGGGGTIDYCDRGGNTYFQDKYSLTSYQWQNSTCSYVDADDICRSADSLQSGDGCTADPLCDGVAAGTGNCNSTCNYIGEIPPNTTIVTLSPSYVAAGQEVTLTVEFNYTNYIQGEDANISLYIIPQGCVEQNCYIRWDDTNGCNVAWKKWVDMNWDKTSHWKGMHKNKQVEITSQDGYAKIETTCTIPSNLPPGTHKVRAIPTVYSLAITLNAAETNFIVLNDFELAFQKVLNNILSFFQRIFL